MNAPAPKSELSAKAASNPRKPAIRFTIGQLDAIGCAAILLLSTVIYFLGVNPLLERHALAIRQQQELESIREKGGDAQKMMVDLHQQSINANEQLEASPLRLQPVSLLNQRLALVTELATQGGAVLDDLQPGKSASGSRYDALPIHVAGTGSYPAFTAMLHQVHSEFPDTGVSTFELSGNPQEDSSKGKFSVELLWFTEPMKRNVDRAGKNPGVPGEAGKGSVK